MSIEFILKINGPKIEPCGTPHSIFNVSKALFYSGAMGTIVGIGEYKLKRLRLKSMPL